MSPLTLSLPRVPLIDFTLSNARRFYSSMGNPKGVKGLNNYCNLLSMCPYEIKRQPISDNKFTIYNSKSGIEGGFTLGNEVHFFSVGKYGFILSLLWRTAFGRCPTPMCLTWPSQPRCLRDSWSVCPLKNNTCSVFCPASIYPRCIIGNADGSC